MRIFKLLSKNLFRNPVRTLLTLSSVAVSLFLVATLVSILIQLTNPPETPGQRNNFSVISGPVVGQEPPLFGSSGPESTGP